MRRIALSSGERGEAAACGPGSGPPCPQALASLLQETVGELEAVKALVLKRIQIWKRQQQLAGNGAPFDESMTLLQERLEQGWRGMEWNGVGTCCLCWRNHRCEREKARREGLGVGQDSE